jgi:signal transduction histidine kinase
MSASSRFLLAVWTATAVFVAVVTTLTLTVVNKLRVDTIDQGTASIAQTVAGAEALVNRTFLSVDLLLGALRDIVRYRDGATPHETRQQLAGVIAGSVLIRDIALASSDGHVLVAANESTERLGLGLPAGFLTSVARQPFPRLTVSDPVEHFATSETVVFFAKSYGVVDGRPIFAVAIVPISQLSSALFRTEDLDGRAITLERSDGRVLVSAPPNGLPASRRMAEPLQPSAADGQARLAMGRTDGTPSLVAARFLLHPDLLVTAGISMESVLARWTRVRSTIFLGGIILCCAIIGAAAGVQRHTTRLASTRQQVLDAKNWLEEALASIREGLLLCDEADKAVAWNTAYLRLFPCLEPVIQVGIPYERLAREASIQLLPDATDAERNLWITNRVAQHQAGRVEFEFQVNPNKIVRVTETRTARAGTVSVFRDITTTDQELARSRIAEQAAAVAKLDYLASVTDTVAVPTNAILGNLELLSLSDDLSSDQRRVIAQARDWGREILQAVSDLHEAAKLSSGVIPLDFAKFEPVAVVEAAVESLGPLARQRRVDLRIESGNLQPLWGDAGRLGLAITSLLRAELEAATDSSITIAHSARPEVGGRVRFALDVVERGLPPRIRSAFVQQIHGISNGERLSGPHVAALQIARATMQAMHGGLSLTSHTVEMHAVRLEAVLDPAPASPTTSST